MPAPPKSRSPPAAASSRKPTRRPFEIDRIILIRAALVVVVVLFLYMIMKVSMIAFGGSAKREAKRIEHAIDNTRMQERPVPEPTAAKPAAAPLR